MNSIDCPNCKKDFYVHPQAEDITMQEEVCPHCSVTIEYGVEIELTVVDVKIQE